MRSGLAALLGLGLLLAGCGEPDAPEVRVFAASSLTGVIRTLSADFERETGTRVVLNLAASSTLARQVVEGAPCDLFLSADEEWADFVVKGRGTSARPPEVLLTNRMVVVLAPVRSDSPVTIAGDLVILDGDLEELYDEKAAIRRALTDPRVLRIAVGDPEHVPAGRYARRGLVALGLWEECRERLVPCESVRAALALVERGEADAGIVYRTDAMGSRLRVVGPWIREVSEAPDPAPPGAVLPGAEARVMAVVPAGGSPAGPRFLEWLRTERAKAVLRAAGFGSPGEGR